MFGGHVFQYTVDIRMGTNCAPPLTDLFIYTHKADLVQGLLKKNENKLAFRRTLPSQILAVLFRPYGYLISKDCFKLSDAEHTN